MTSIAIRRSLHPKYICETVRYARSVLYGRSCSPARSNRLPDEISVVEPPDPIPNSEVKRNSADGSVGFPCESRSSSGSYPGTLSRKVGGSSFVRRPSPGQAAAPGAAMAGPAGSAQLKARFRGPQISDDHAPRTRFVKARSSAMYPRTQRWLARWASRAALNGLPSRQFGQVPLDDSDWPTRYRASRSSTMPSYRQPSWISSPGRW